MAVQAVRRAAVVTGLVALSVAASMAAVWGFTVDDALISSRVAYHLAAGAGYRFNVGGPVVDAVTPLGWAQVLAPFAAGGPLAALDLARVLGAGCVLVAACLVAWRIATTHASPRASSALAMLAMSVPLSAWAVSGMETGVVVLLATLGALQTRWAPLAAGLAAAWRPELIPWAAVVGWGAAAARGESWSLRLRGLALATGPSLAVMSIRALAFGSPAPLAVLAKPSDTEHGLFYAAVAVIWSGPPALLVAVRAWRRVAPRERVLALAAAVHVLSLVAAGGDWMPYSRLMAPVLPSIVLAGAAVAAASHPWAIGGRLVLGAAAFIVLHVESVPAARQVVETRRALSAELAPLVLGVDRVATVDVGWVGTATGATVVDLAGVTDPEVAALAGGHTSKQLPRGFAERRRIGALVLLLAAGELPREPWTTTRFARAVEQRIADQCRDLPFVAETTLTGGRAHGPKYVLLRRVRDTALATEPAR